MDDPIIIACPICGCEDETAGIKLHGQRKLPNMTLPPGESFSCADNIGCGFYVEVNRQGVLEPLFSKISGRKEV